jgi:dynein heavy chain 1
VAPTKAYQLLLLTKCFTPEKLLLSMIQYVNSVFLNRIKYEKSESIFVKNVQRKSGLRPGLSTFFVLSDRGFDTSYKVESAAYDLSVPLTSVAMGSIEAHSLAEKAITKACKHGGWVLLKNVHLALHWLCEFEKRMKSYSSLNEVKLFFTSEITVILPVNLLRVSRIFFFAPPRGIKASLIESLSTTQLGVHTPVEKNRILLALAWIHAIVVERLQYAPVGWTKRYDFNDSDFIVAAGLVDWLLQHQSEGRSNITPSKIPWKAIEHLVSKCIYGGKVDRTVDQEILDVIAKELLTPNIFAADFAITKKIKLPEGNNISKYIEWARKLDDNELTPTVIGLSNDSDVLLKIQTGTHV